MGMNLDVVIAIDVHTHAERASDGHLALPEDLMAASAAYFRTEVGRAPSLDDLASYYRERSMAAVVFTVDSEHELGHPAVPNDEVALAAQRHPDVLIPFASIDPHRGEAGITEARRLVTNLGVRGFKFHPTVQGFAPNDRMTYPLYEEIAALGVPALFHTGQTGIGAGMPGGRGLRLSYSNPLLLDDVAADFPTLSIVMAHPSFPWQEEALAVATHKQNVWIDLSGWSPKYFPPILIQYVNSILQDKVMFGSDFPLITPDRWIRDFDALTIKDGVRQLVLRDNAIRLLGL